MTKEASATPAKITTNQEYANLVPPLSAEEYQSLKQSIKQNGLWVPIVTNNQGVILDGHHRFKACKELGIEPQTVTKDFADKLHEQLFVIDSNLERRHLNNFRRTELALKSKSILQEIAKKHSRANLKQQRQQLEKGDASPSDRNLTVGSSSSSSNSSDQNASAIGGRVDEKIARRAGVSRDTVRKVEEIQQAVKASPEELGYLIKQLDDGDITVNEACNVIARHKQEQLERKEERAKQAIIKKREELKKQNPDLTNTAIKNMFHDKRSCITDEVLDEAGIDIGKDILLVQADRILSRPDKEKVKSAAVADVHDASTTTTTSSSISTVANLEDYDPNKRDSYDRQTLYKVIDWLSEQNRMLREANRNLRANNTRAANDNSTTSNKGGVDV